MSYLPTNANENPLKKQKSELSEDVLTGITTKSAVNDDPFCVALELIALLLHRGDGGDNSSATTLCFMPSNGTLYVTSQLIKEFPQLFPVDEKGQSAYYGAKNVGAIDQYKKLARTNDDTDKLRSYIDKLIQYKDNLDGLREELDLLPDDVPTNRKSKKAKAIIRANSGRRIVDATFTLNMNKVSVEHLKKLGESIGKVKIIHNKDLFDKSSTEQRAGLHGESRIIRFLFIKFFPKQASLQDEDPVKAEAAFRKFIGPVKLYFGSSQGTCPDCCRFLDALNALHGPEREGNESHKWVNPISMVGKDKLQRLPNAYTTALAVTGRREKAKKVGVQETTKASKMEEDD